jgi:purine-binding chemotaxis protein CheW
MNQLFTLRLDGHRYALRLQDVERVVRMVEITALPEAPSAVLGLINVQGRVLSVIDLRACFNLPSREVDPEDVLVIVRTAGGEVALAADGVDGVSEWPEQSTVRTEKILPAPLHLEGVVKLPNGLVLICDLDQIIAGRRTQDSIHLPAPPSGGEQPGAGEVNRAVSGEPPGGRVLSDSGVKK